MLRARAITRPRTTILIGIASVGLASAGLGRLEIRADGRSLVPTGSRQVKYDTLVRLLRNLIISGDGAPARW